MAESHLAKTVRTLYPLAEGAPGIAVEGEQGSRVEPRGDVEEMAEVEEATARDLNVDRKPAAPTKAMVLAHEVHHADYREWCEHCVAGKGVSHQHRASQAQDSSCSEFSVDYAFMTQCVSCDCARPVIVGYDHGSRGVWAMVVDSKGATESSTKWLNGKINEAGHSGTKIVMKSDQEEPIMAPKRSVAIKRQPETVMLESPVRDSRAHGMAERTVRTWASQVRMLRHHLESRIKVKIDNDSAIMTWLVTWAADVLTRYKVHGTGRTSYEHTTGHRGIKPIAACGENIMFKYTSDKNKRDKMDSEWDSGFFVGINPKTTEYLIAKELACSPVRRFADYRTTRHTMQGSLKLK